MTQPSLYRLLAWGTILLIGSAAISMIGGSATPRQPAAAAHSPYLATPLRRAVTGGASSGIRWHQRLVRVTIHNFAFKPARLVILPGTRVIWTNTDSDPHTVDSAKGFWASDALDTGDRFGRVFTKTGTYTYYCSIHPFMHGTIVVKK